MRGIGLRVEVDQKRFLFAKGNGGSKIDGSGGLPHSAFLICDGQDGGHKLPGHFGTGAKASVGWQPIQNILWDCPPSPQGTPNLLAHCARVQAKKRFSRVTGGRPFLSTTMSVQAEPDRDLGHIEGFEHEGGEGGNKCRRVAHGRHHLKLLHAEFQRFVAGFDIDLMKSFNVLGDKCDGNDQ